VEGVVIATPNDKTTAVTVPATVTGAVEFKLTVTYKEKSSEAVTNVTLTGNESNILHVASDGSGDGSSWANALRGNIPADAEESDTMSLQTVIDTAGAAVANDEQFDSIEIWVKSGTYLPTWNWDTRTEQRGQYTSFKLQSGVSVIGGFAGDESSKSARVKSDVAGRIYASETILSGDMNGDDTPLQFTCETLVAGEAQEEEGKKGLRIPLTPTVADCSEDGAYIKGFPEFTTYDDNVLHVFYHNDAALTLDGTAILDGVVIRGGDASRDGAKYYGGGILNVGSVSPTIISTIVEYNSARAGAGIYNNAGASPTIISSIIQYNNASEHGGGMTTFDDASANVVSSIIQYNYATLTGGGLRNWRSATVNITASLVKSNYAGSKGGGVYSGDAADSVYRASVIKNNGSYHSGGGFHSQDEFTITTIISSIIQSNFAVSGGGGGINVGNKSTLGLINSAVIENMSYDQGAGISGKDNLRRIQLYNSIISDNISYRADLSEGIQIDSDGPNNTEEETVVFSSIVNTVKGGDSMYNDAEVTFYNMIDGTVAPTLAGIDFGSYSDSDTGATYTLPNPITTVKSLADNSDYSNTGVIVGRDAAGNDFYYQDPAGEDKWYNFKNEEVAVADRPADITIITGSDIYGNVDAGRPDIGPITMTASEEGAGGSADEGESGESAGEGESGGSAGEGESGESAGEGESGGSAGEGESGESDGETESGESDGETESGESADGETESGESADGETESGESAGEGESGESADGETSDDEETETSGGEQDVGIGGE
ncbi:MAG: hypothetical protein ACN4E2_04055, partial [Nitrospinota bacterium]